MTAQPAKSPPVGRFAPTPSGRLHLGNLLCALIAFLSVKHEGGRFLLRIEDLDVPRCPRSLSEQAMEDLSFLGIRWDEPPLWQSLRTRAYEQAQKTLEEKGLIYPCFCTRAQLHTGLAPNEGDTTYLYSGACASLTPAEIALKRRARAPALRVRVPDREIGFTDMHYGSVRENLARETGDFIIRRSDGLFAYQLAVVVDDALSGITQVVRGRDILSSTPRQLYLFEQLGYTPPAYAHIPLLTDHEGRRLAKRDKDLSLDALRLRFSREQLLGLLACACGLQQTPAPTEIDALIAGFDWKRVCRSDMRLPKEILR